MEFPNQMSRNHRSNPTYNSCTRRHSHGLLLIVIVAIGFLYAFFLVMISRDKRLSIDQLNGFHTPIEEGLANSVGHLLSPHEITQRARRSVLAAFVSDAATMGLHWQYNVEKIKRLVDSQLSEAKNPEFFEPPSSPFYKYETGSFSPYGDEILPLLRYLSSNEHFNPEEFVEVSFQANYNYSGRLNHVMKEFVEKYDQGLRWPNLAVLNHDAHSLIKAPILVARYGGLGNDQLKSIMRKAIFVHQNDPIAVDVGIAAALILEKIVMGDSIEEAIMKTVKRDTIPTDVQAAIGHVIALHEQNLDISSAIAQFGKGCSLPGAFQGALYILLSTTDYEKAIRENIMAGGDNCSRGIYIGACLAALSGNAVVPKTWEMKTNHFAEVEELIDKVVAIRNPK